MLLWLISSLFAVLLERFYFIHVSPTDRSLVVYHVEKTDFRIYKAQKSMAELDCFFMVKSDVVMKLNYILSYNRILYIIIKMN